MAKLSELIRIGAGIVGNRKAKNNYFERGPGNVDGVGPICSACANGAAALGTGLDYARKPATTEAILADMLSPAIPVESHQNCPPEQALWMMAYREENKWSVDSSGIEWTIHDLIVTLNDLTDMSLLEIADYIEAIGY